MGGSTDINYPSQPSYSESLRDSLTAQIELAPELFRSESDPMYGRPAYAALETDILRDTLLGQRRFTPEGGEPTALRDLGLGGAGGQPVSVAGGRYQTIYRPGAITDDDQRQFSVDLIDPQTGEIVMSETGQFRGDALGGPISVGADTEAIGQAMQSLFGNAAERGLVTAPEAAQAVQVGTLAITGDTATYTAPRPGTAMDVGTEAEKWEAYVNMNPDLKEAWGREGGDISEWGKGHYEQFGASENRFLPEIGKTYDTATGGEYVPTVQEGTMDRGEGLLELVGGREAGYRDGEFQGLATYGTDIAKQAASRQREADIGDVETFGVRASEAIKAADPLSAQLLGTLGTQAQEELAAGGDLTQRQREGAIKDARLGWEARGRVRDPGAVVSELENLERAREMRKAQRRGFAGQVMGQSRAMSADPFMSILGRPSGASQQIATGAVGGAQYGLSAGPQLYSPESGISYQLGQSQNLANVLGAEAAANATRQAGLYRGIGSAVGSIIPAIPGLGGP